MEVDAEDGGRSVGITVSGRSIAQLGQTRGRYNEWTQSRFGAGVSWATRIAILSFIVAFLR